MKIVVAFEGMDGSGKTSLAVYTRKLCEQHNQRYTLVGRRETYSSPLVGRMTRFLHDEGPNLSPHSEAFLRLARENERAHLAASTPSGVVVLDRFVLSSLSLVRLGGQDVEPILRLLRDITVRAHLFATVFVRCPFEVARIRVKERNANMPGKRSRDERFLRRLAELMEDDFERGILTGQQWPVDNSESLSAAEEQISSYLTPYLLKGQQAPLAVAEAPR